jgi:hypothetical protein
VVAAHPDAPAAAELSRIAAALGERIARQTDR